MFINPALTFLNLDCIRNCKIFSTRQNMELSTSVTDPWFVLRLYRKKNVKRFSIHSASSSSEFCGNGKTKRCQINRRMFSFASGCRNETFCVRIFCCRQALVIHVILFVFERSQECSRVYDTRWIVR